MSDSAKPRIGRPSRTLLQAAFSAAEAKQKAPEMQESAPSDVLESPKASPRPPLRQEMREEDPRARAAKRAAEIRGHVGNMDEGTDEFFIPPEMIPEGWTYEWKRRTVLGQEDPAYQVSLARMGWDVVPADRHPTMMPTGRHAEIQRKGMVLMERPKEITDEARRIEARKARNQVRAKEEQLSAAPSGQFERNTPTVKKAYSPIAIPADNE